jgi:N-acetylneuraminic acid mutarotase
MSSRPAFRHLLALMALLVASTAWTLHVPGPPLEGALRRRFPAQAARVLEASTPLRADGAPVEVAGLRARLPQRGDAALHFSLDGGFEARVREVGAFGEAAPAGRAVAYARAGGTSYWAADADGYEEWLLLGRGAIRAGVPAALWEVDGARLRQQGEAVALCDARGAARILVTAPEAYAAGGRPVGTRLSTRAGRFLELWVDGADGEEVLVDPGWKVLPNSALQIPRSSHTATLLPDGRVLIAGGFDAEGKPLSDTEIYDPITRSFSLARPMDIPHADATATALADGRVLVVGGVAEVTDEGRFISRASELYDPSTGLWRNARSPSYFYSSASATRLGDADPRVLLLVGSSGDRLAREAEVYDPSSNTWTLTGPMSGVHNFAPLTALTDGRAFVFSGFGIDNTAEIYDPSSNAWTAVTPVVRAMAGGLTTLLDDGQVLVAGGIMGNAPQPLSLLYRPPGQEGREGWSDTAARMNVPRAGHAGVKLRNGRVLVIGGFAGGDASRGFAGLRATTSTAELYEPDRRTWRNAGRMSTGRAFHTATLLQDGTVLVVGGVDNNFTPLGTAELYEPPKDAWTDVATMQIGRRAHTATRLKDGRVLVAGGVIGDLGQSTNQVEIYDGALDAWELAPPMGYPRKAHTATPLENGEVLVVGGVDESPLIGSSAEIYDPGTNTWRPALNMQLARVRHAAAWIPGDRVLVIGGLDENASLMGTAEIYDPIANLWAFLPSMRAPRAVHTATPLLDGDVLVVGGRGGDTGDIDLDVAERFAPTGQGWTTVAPISLGRSQHAAALLDDGTLLVAGGIGFFAPGNSVETFDPTSGTWTTVGSMTDARWDFTATLLENKGLLVTGGAVSLRSAEVYDPRRSDWTRMDSMHAGRVEHTATRLQNGDVLVVGGRTPDEPESPRAELFRLADAGSPCQRAAECKSGICVDGVCCNEACDAGLCDACSVGTGADEDGLCKQLVTGCGDYRCSPDEGRCREDCASIDDCAEGRACSPDYRCVAPLGTASTRRFGECAAAPAAPPEGAPAPRSATPALLLLAAAAGALRRRAPASATSRSAPPPCPSRGGSPSA